MNSKVRLADMAEIDNEQYYRSLCDAAPISMALVGVDYRYIVVNEHYAAHFKKQTHELIGLTMEEVLGELVFNKSSKPNFDLALQGESIKFRTWAKQPSKRQCYLAIAYAPFRDESGKICAIHISTTDITDMKLQEQELLRYEQIVNSSNDIMCFVNKDYTYEAVNQRFLDAFDVTRNQVIGHKQIEVVGVENFNRISKPSVDKALNGEFVHGKSWSFQKGSGERYMDFNYSPCLNEDAEVSGVIVNSQDITESFKAEIDIELYNAIINTSADYLAIIDQDFRYLIVNQKYAEAFNVSMENIAGRHVSEVIGQECFEAVSKPNIEACIKNGKQHISSWFIHPNGGRRYLSMEYFAHKNVKGKLLCILVAGHDLTELFASRLKLEERERSLSQAQQIAGLGVWELDPETNIMMVSPETIKILCNNCHDADWFNSYENIQSLFHPDDASKLHRVMGDSLISGKSIDIEHRIIWPDGSVRWAHVQANMVLKDGKVTRMLGTTLDITKHKEAEAEILKLNLMLEGRVERRNKQLLEANKSLNRSFQELKETQGQLIMSEKMASLGSLVAGVAHEINTPIGMSVSTASFLQDRVKLWADLYQKESFSREDCEEMFATSAESLQILMTNLTRTVELVRSFKQVAVDQSSEKVRSFFMRQYLEEIIQSLKPEFKNKLYKIILNCPQSLEVHTNPGAISQIFTNLLINSVLHGFNLVEGGTIKIDVAIENSMVKIVYSDDGKGIEPENLGKVFEPFFTTRRGKGGSGLGMHIVYNLVSQTLKGTVQCSSDLGHGVIFSISFPLSQRPAVCEHQTE